MSFARLKVAMTFFDEVVTINSGDDTATQTQVNSSD